MAPTPFSNAWVGDADFWCQLLVDMHMSWCVLLSEDDNAITSGAAEALLDAGVIPLIRFPLRLPAQFTQMAAVEQFVNLYSQYDAPCIVLPYNEPLLPVEWQNQDIPRTYDETMEVFTERWANAAQRIAERGAIAGFPDGPCFQDNPFYWVQSTWDLFDADQAIFAGHWYGLNRPVMYPYESVTRYGEPPLSYESYKAQLDDYGTDPDWNEGPGVVGLMNDQRRVWACPDLTATDDPTCWRGYEQAQYYSQEAFGRVIPLAMTEGGWTPRARAGSGDNVDIRWPYPTPKKVAQNTLMAFRLNEMEGTLFAMCPWLLADGAMNGGSDVGWPFDSWVTWAFQDKYGMEKPVVNLLKENPPGE